MKGKKYFAVVATRAGSALGFGRQLAGDGIAARIRVVALLDGPAIAFLAVLDDAIAASAEVLELQKKNKIK
jgi:hypothetical protein